MVCPSCLCILKCTASQISPVEPMSCSKTKDSDYAWSPASQGLPSVFFFVILTSLWLSFMCHLSSCPEAFPQFCPQIRILLPFPYSYSSPRLHGGDCVLFMLTALWVLLHSVSHCYKLWPSMIISVFFYLLGHEPQEGRYGLSPYWWEYLIKRNARSLLPWVALTGDWILSQN